MKSLIFISKSEKATRNFAKAYAKKLKGGDVIYLIGDLGSGKTQFVKGVAEYFGIGGSVTSPTFVYENIYKVNQNLRLYHFDLYRENNLDEDVRLMIEEAIEDRGGITMIEWADRIKDNFVSNPIVINFYWLGENERKLEIFDERTHSKKTKKKNNAS